MRRQLTLLAMILGVLLVMDLAVAGILRLGDTRVPALRPLVQFFEYGRSVPGKLDEWIAHPGTRGNLFEVAWMDGAVAWSAEEFAAEDPESGPIVRAYGMSFLAGMLRGANERDPDLRLDMVGGPAAPPNLSYALFLDDRANRRPGDVVVLGILSSSLTGLAAMSNRTWAFEQPAPFTYPVFLPEGETGLRRIEPLVRSAEMERSLSLDPDLAAEWAEQLSRHDAFYTAEAFALPALDVSPFARLVRRSLATSAIAERKHRIAWGEGPDSFPLEEVLARLITDFAAIARADRQIPVIYLIQSRDPQDRNLLELAAPTLAVHDIPYVATSEIFDPRDLSGFKPDGHYIPRVDGLFSAAFLELMSDIRNGPADGFNRAATATPDP